MPRGNICVVIPAYNEERVIEASLRALCRVVRKNNIYVVSDGSKDATAKIAKRIVPHVLALRKNRGKAKALKALMDKFQLTSRYKYILFADADSQLVPNFVEEIKKSAASNPACIVGRVMSHRHALVSAYRTYEYGLTNRVFRQAQSHLKVVAVAPGCCSLYRSDVLAQLTFSERTLTEDFDLTLQIYRKKLGHIIYAPNALVFTQDPPTLKDYWRQLIRWYTGFWQNIFLHRVYVPNSRINLEILFMISDITGWLAIMAVGIFNPMAFVYLLITGEIFVTILATILISWDKQWWALKYVPLFIIFPYINIVSYLYSLVRTIVSGKKKLSWQKLDRYTFHAGRKMQKGSISI